VHDGLNRQGDLSLCRCDRLWGRRDDQRRDDNKGEQGKQRSDQPHRNPSGVDPKGLDFGSLAIPDSQALGPMALRPRLSTGLPLSDRDARLSSLLPSSPPGTAVTIGWQAYSDRTWAP